MTQTKRVRLSLRALVAARDYTSTERTTTLNLLIILLNLVGDSHGLLVVS